MKRATQPYLLPVKLDGTEPPAMLNIAGYVDLRQVSVESLVQITLEKLSE